MVWTAVRNLPLWQLALWRCILKFGPFSGFYGFHREIFRTIGNMDLPTCPSCKQSVLDDDAVECPFCGSPMKGSAASSQRAASPGGAKLPPAKQAPGAPAARGTAVKAASAGGRSGAEAETPASPAADDDPFGVDASVGANAIPVSRQQGPGKTLEVTCPMCETKGYVAPKAAGKLVKCCNPNCMVPTFTAPIVKKAEPVAPPPAPKKKVPWVYVIAGAAVVIIAPVAIWFIMQTGPTEIPPGSPPSITTTPLNDQGKSAEAIAQSEEGDNHKAERTDETVATPNPRDELVKSALNRLAELSINTKPNRRSLLRRLAATAYLHAGDMKHARDELDALQKASSPYEGVLPLVDLAWSKLAASPDEFKRAAEEAQALALKLPKRGRYATEAAVAAAPLLVVSGKNAVARQLLDDHGNAPLIEQLAAASRVVIDNQTYDLNTTLIGRTVGDWQAPMETAVTLILASHGRWDDAFAWATDSAANPVTRIEGVIVWAESFARHAVPAQDAAGFERALKAADALSGGDEIAAAGKVRLLARLADVKLSAGDKTAAEELLGEALAGMAALTPDSPLIVHGAKPLLDLKLRDPVPLKQAALAATEIAGVQTRLGRVNAAWDNVLLAVRFIQGIGLSMGAMQERSEQLQREPDKIRKELKAAMALKRDDEVRRAFNQYKEKAKDVFAATMNRFLSQTVVFESAAKFGLLDQVWDELQVLDRKPDVQERERFLFTGLPLFVAARYEAAGNEKKKEEIESLVEPRVDPADPTVVLPVTERLVNAGDIAACVAQLNAVMKDDGTLHEWTMTLACKLVKAGKIGDAAALCSGIKDVALREDALFLTSALAARLGHGQEVRKASSGLSGIDSAAVSSGLIAGLSAVPAGK